MFTRDRKGLHVMCDKCGIMVQKGARNQLLAVKLAIYHGFDAVIEDDRGEVKNKHYCPACLKNLDNGR